jgi:hypothetical protein
MQWYLKCGLCFETGRLHERAGFSLPRDDSCISRNTRRWLDMCESRLPLNVADAYLLPSIAADVVVASGDAVALSNSNSASSNLAEAADDHLSVAERAFLRAWQCREKSFVCGTASSTCPTEDELVAWGAACSSLSDELREEADAESDSNALLRDSHTLLLFFSFGFLKRARTCPPRCLCCLRSQPFYARSHVWSNALLSLLPGNFVCPDTKRILSPDSLKWLTYCKTRGDGSSLPACEDLFGENDVNVFKELVDTMTSSGTPSLITYTADFFRLFATLGLRLIVDMGTRLHIEDVWDFAEGHPPAESQERQMRLRIASLYHKLRRYALTRADIDQLDQCGLRVYLLSSSRAHSVRPCRDEDLYGHRASAILARASDEDVLLPYVHAWIRGFHVIIATSDFDIRGMASSSGASLRGFHRINPRGGTLSADVLADMRSSSLPFLQFIHDNIAADIAQNHRQMASSNFKTIASQAFPGSDSGVQQLLGDRRGSPLTSGVVTRLPREILYRHNTPPASDSIEVVPPYRVTICVDDDFRDSTYGDTCVRTWWLKHNHLIEHTVCVVRFARRDLVCVTAWELRWNLGSSSRTVDVSSIRPMRNTDPHTGMSITPVDAWTTFIVRAASKLPALAPL